MAHGLGGFNLCQGLAGIEICGKKLDFLDEFGGPGQVVDFKRGQELVALLREGKRPALVLAAQEPHARHEFSKGESLGKAFGGAFQLVF